MASQLPKPKKSTTTYSLGPPESLLPTSPPHPQNLVDDQAPYNPPRPASPSQPPFPRPPVRPHGCSRGLPPKATPISPPSGPAPRLLQGPPSKSKFLAAGYVNHSGKVSSVAHIFGPGEKFDEAKSTLRSKWGQAPLNNETFQANAAQYGRYTCYTRTKSNPDIKYPQKGDNER